LSTFDLRSYHPPPWLPLDPDPPGRSTVLLRLCTLLSHPQAMVSLLAPPGTGGTTVAGAVATRMSRRLPVCVTRLVGDGSVPQLFHIIGHALGSPFPRDQAAVCEALREAGPTLLVLDDADTPATRTVVERLAAVAPEARFLAVGRAPALDGSTLHLAPLSDPDGAAGPFPHLEDPTITGIAGCLLLKELARQQLGTAEDPWSFLDGLPDGADLLAAFPAGIPGRPPTGLPAILLLPGPTHHCMLRRSVAEALTARRQREPQDLAMGLLPRCGHLLRVAEEPALATSPDPRDLEVVHFIATHHPDPGEAARAAAAWSRFQVVAGQTSGARVWQDESRERPKGGRFAALLAWAEGDALLADGELGDAQVAYEFAATQLRHAGDARLLAELHLRCSDLLHGRGALSSSEEQSLNASELYSSLADPVGQALALRAQAGVAQARGQLDRAEQLLARAQELASRQLDVGALPCSLYLARAGLALARRRADDAEEQLWHARTAVAGHPLLRANRERLLGSLALQRGELEEAERHLAGAIEWFAKAGERTALASSLRLMGDVAALRGRPLAADARYQQATREQVRAGDLRGLARTLAHRASLERELGSPEAAEELESLCAELESLAPPG